VLAPFTDVVQCLHCTPPDRTVTTPNYLNNSSPDPSTAAAFFNSDQPLHGADATCPFLVPATQATWLHSLLDSVNHFPAQLGLFCLVISIPISELSTDCSTFASAMSAALPTWQLTAAILNSATYGDGVSALRWMSIATRPRHLEPCYQPQLPTPSASFATPFDDFVRSELCSPSSAICSLPPTPTILDMRPPDPFLPHVLMLVPPAAGSSADQLITIFDPDFPSPEPDCRLSHHSFALPFSDSVGCPFARPADQLELLDLYSTPPVLVQYLHALPMDPSDLHHCLHSSTPFATAAALADSVVDLIFHSLDHGDLSWQPTILVLLQHAHRPATAIDWTTAYAANTDTSFIIDRLSTNS
jgi:hypothetical protein